MSRLGDLPPPEEGSAPGYYTDPLGEQDQRLWDGSEWTTRVRPKPPPEHLAGSPKPPAEVLAGSPKPNGEPLADGNDEPLPRRPREVGAILSSAFKLYRRYPLLFFALAAGVIVTYDVVVLATTGDGAFSRDDQSVALQAGLGLIEWVLVGPLISALHVHAVAEIRGGRDPELGEVAVRGLRALPVVVAATIMAGLGIALGLIALIVPGVILAFRWYVVAQVAALEPGGWLEALRGSHRLTKGNYLHIFVFGLVLGVVVGIPGGVLAAILGGEETTTATFLVELATHLFTASFAALSTAIFYFDLVARRETSAEAPPSA